MVFGLEPINQAILGNNYIFCVLCLWLFLQKSGDLNLSFFPSQDWHGSSALRGNYTEGLNRAVCGGSLGMSIGDVLSDYHVLRSQSNVQVEGCTPKTIPEDQDSFAFLEFTRMDSFQCYL